MKFGFNKKGPFSINKLLKNCLHLKKNQVFRNSKIKNISTLENGKKDEISFLENINYLESFNKSNVSFCLVKEKNIDKLKNKNVKLIFSENPLIDFILIAKLFYPNADYDNQEIKINKKFIKKNSFVCKSAKIGKKFNIGYNSVIKGNVIIGNNVTIGSNCTISNSIIEDNVIINDGSVVGKIGFGFKFINNKINFIPHIGHVKICKNVYIGSNCSIDRGSFSNTIIGNDTMIDNNVHIAHNVQIGSYCIITGQVGIAGSSKIGNKCMIGGQTGISGHLNIGDNVHIGGHSGVLKNIENNSRVMGYPAVSIKEFLKRSK
ncbi:MAG: UDP-3-O-(3-hydroxymyristoyl)glucosamine N-acyltransferase [Pelagibacteraceae bacterium]